MKNTPIIIMMMGMLCASLAQAVPPSYESVKQLMEVSKADKNMDPVFAQLDDAMKSSLQRAMKGRSLSASEQAIVDKQQAKMVAIIKGELSWKTMEKSMIQVYRDTFSQEEVDGLIKFYQSPTGRAFVEKQPEFMVHTMAVMQERMGPIMDKIREIAKETGREIAALHKEK